METLVFTPARKGEAYTNKALLKDIDRKAWTLSKTPYFIMAREKQFQASLRNLSNVYSWWINNQSLRCSINEEMGESRGRSLREYSVRNLTRLENAWSYLRKLGRSTGVSTDSFLSPCVIKQVASCIDDKNKKGYRAPNEQATLFYPEYEAPSSFQVPNEIEEMADIVGGSKMHPVDKAIYAHLSIIRIQPFVSANKRVGKLFQESILFDYDYTPGLIYPSDRELYSRVLRGALVEETPSSQSEFYNFMAQKINTSLDTLINRRGDIK